MRKIEIKCRQPGQADCRVIHLRSQSSKSMNDICVIRIVQERAHANVNDKEKKARTRKV